ncbi:EpsG family protein [Clostridium sp.]|uniref:EpsG family protein n=1 Tax=Clostridium sp. TaxID=1506 RepID=UPI0026370F51|nr:EpsG family protein [Clostridium sp.]
MIYILIQLVLIMCCFIIKDKEKKEMVYKISFIFLVLFLIIRYGQGSDYFNYNIIFNNIVGYENVFQLGDPGFNILIVFTRSLGISYIQFNSIIAIISMMLIYRFFNKFCEDKLLGLTVFYPVYYMVFWFSAIRQGLAISIFVGILLPLLYNKKYILYIIGTIITATFHLSAMFLLVLIVVKFIPLYNKKVFGGLSILIILYQVFNIQNLLIKMLPQVFQSRIYVYLSDGISYGALANRLIIFFIIMYLFYRNNEKSEEYNLFLINIYIFGFFLYLILMKSPTIASRLNFYIKIIDCVLIANLACVGAKANIKTFRLLLVSAIMIVILIKNISSLLYQGNYYSYVSVMDYPYITVFNKDSIHSYRQISEDIRYRGLYPVKYQWPVVIDEE